MDGWMDGSIDGWMDFSRLLLIGCLCVVVDSNLHNEFAYALYIS